jgi:hypothetical protein
MQCFSSAEVVAREALAKTPIGQVRPGPIIVGRCFILFAGTDVITAS